MKRIIVAVAAVMFVLAFATAFADEMPIMTESKEVGTLLNSEAPGNVINAPAKDFGRPLVSETPIEVGTGLYLSAFEPKLAEGVTGAAAGGVAREDENTRIWDNLMGAPGGSDLP